MLWWLVSGMSKASYLLSTTSNEMEKAGATLGTGIGLTIIGAIWVFGDIIIGLLTLMTRPKE